MTRSGSGSGSNPSRIIAEARTIKPLSLVENILMTYVYPATYLVDNGALSVKISSYIILCNAKVCKQSLGFRELPTPPTEPSSFNAMAGAGIASNKCAHLKRIIKC